MTALTECIKFAERYLIAPDGSRFSLKGREWVRDELYLPLHGFKLWPRKHDGDYPDSIICDPCSARANTLVEDYYAADDTRTPEHEATGCMGLKTEPLLVVALNVKRQEGKTFNTAGYALSRVFKHKRESIAFMAAAEDQAGRIFKKNYEPSIKNSKKLQARCSIVGDRLSVHKNRSDIEILPTSLSAVSDTRTVVIIDEAREVPPDVAMALIPMLFARGGWQCPGSAKHVKTYKGADDPEKPNECTVCGKRTEPWFGQLIITSSFGMLKDSDRDWFPEFVELYTNSPHPNVHLFASQEDLNPKVSAKMVGGLSGVFGALETTSQFVDVEMLGENRRKGDDVVSPSDVKRCTDKRLENILGCSDPCVGFLDTSTTVDKSSLVILADDVELSTYPWEYIYQARLDFWDPAKLPGGVIDDAEIMRHLVNLLPLFSGLKTLPVDTRGMPWAISMVKAIKAKHPSLARIIQPWNKHNQESDKGWDVLSQRMLTRPKATIRLQECDEQKKEFKGIKWQHSNRADKPSVVVDRDRKRIHRDITESLACCCYLVAEQAIGVDRSSAANRRDRASSRDVKDKLKNMKRPRRLSRGFGENGF